MFHRVFILNKNYFQKMFHQVLEQDLFIFLEQKILKNMLHRVLEQDLVF